MDDLDIAYVMDMQKSLMGLDARPPPKPHSNQRWKVSSGTTTLDRGSADVGRKTDSIKRRNAMRKRNRTQTGSATNWFVDSNVKADADADGSSVKAKKTSMPVRSVSQPVLNVPKILSEPNSPNWGTPEREKSKVTFCFDVTEQLGNTI